MQLNFAIPFLDKFIMLYQLKNPFQDKVKHYMPSKIWSEKGDDDSMGKRG